MRKLILFAVLLSLSSQAAGIPGSPSGAVTSAEAPNVETAPTTINAQCSTPSAGCAAGTAVTIKLGGRNSATAHVIHSAFTSGWSAFVSTDKGVTWSASIPIKSTLSGVATPVTQVNVSASSATIDYAILIPYPGVTDVMFAAVTAVTGTATVALEVTNANANMMTLATAKGVQSLGGAAMAVQPLADSGRSYVALSADSQTPAASETLITFTKTVADTQTTGQTSYTITNLKTLRIQSICASMTAGAAANRVRVALRLNTGGACIATSNILLPVVELAPQYGTAAASEGGANGCVLIPDGLEISGNGTKAICLSAIGAAASGTLTANLVAFEY